MTDPWRIKRYYNPRVLIEVGRVLNPAIPDSLICLTGQQAEMLRNLTQYLHRRATWVSEYRTSDYLAPTEEEWSQLEPIIAELEDTLMGCTDITDALAEIAAQIACLCTQAQQSGRVTPLTTPAIEDWVDDGTLQWSYPFGDESEPVDATRCAVAQLVYAFAYEMLTEVIQPAQSAAIDILLPLALGAIATWVGTPVLGLSVATFVALMEDIIDAWVDSALANVVNALTSNKTDLVCAVYDGLETDSRTAWAMAKDVIDDMELAPIDTLVLYGLFDPMVQASMIAAWTAETSWATSNVTPGYCSVCEPPQDWPYLDEFAWPPCPGSWTGVTCSSSSRPGINAETNGYSPEFSLPSIDLGIVAEITCEWYSSKTTGWTVGYITLQVDNGVGGWTNLWSYDATNTTTPGNLNVDDRTSGVLEPAINNFRWLFGGQAGQWDVNPYPFEPTLIVITIDQEEE